MQRSHWVFGYGSLMWKPGFAAIRAVPATVQGYHRALCVYSHKYRGCTERPGLVFGLDRGGSCQGMAMEIDSESWPATHAYLRERELVTHVYREVMLPVNIRGKSQTVQALAYVVDRNHDQYAGKMELVELLALIRQGHGEAGSCRDYVLNTFSHLRELGLTDRRLEQLCHHL